MVLIGQSRSGTVIRLADHTPGFQDTAAPRGVVMTASKLLDGTATSGGKDYTGKGEGNDAYDNFVEDLTVDVGHGNPGAIGIDYLGNNIGAIRDVTVSAPAGSGATGISMRRKWPGPALLQRVTVHGFQTGIAVCCTEYGVTLDHVSLAGQRETGITNDGNAVSAAHLAIEGAPSPMVNAAPGGLITLVEFAVAETGPGARYDHRFIGRIAGCSCATRRSAVALGECVAVRRVVGRQIGHHDGAGPSDGDWRGDRLSAVRPLRHPQ